MIPNTVKYFVYYLAQLCVEEDMSFSAGNMYSWELC